MADLQNLPQQVFDPARFTRPDFVDKSLYVFTPVFNSPRYKSTWKLYKSFEKHVLDSGAHLVTVECVFGERANVLKELKNPNHSYVTVTTSSEIWLKENILNVAMQYFPEAEYIATIDGDVHFARPDWVGETIQKLQHYDIVQMFSQAMDVTPDYEAFSVSYGFGHDYVNGVPEFDNYGSPFRKANHWHTGYAWAYRRKALSDLGGLVDWAILGSADHHMAWSLIGQWTRGVHQKLTPEYRNMIDIWQSRAMTYIKKNIGYVPGLLVHNFHGHKQHRQYKSRWNILVDYQFNPLTDIKKDITGIWQLVVENERQIGLRDAIKKYFSQRNGDSIHTYDAKLIGL